MVIAVEMKLDVQKLKKMFKRSVSSISGHSLSSNLCCLLNVAGGSYRFLFCSLNLNRLRATFKFKHFCGLKVLHR